MRSEEFRVELRKASEDDADVGEKENLDRCTYQTEGS